MKNRLLLSVAIIMVVLAAAGVSCGETSGTGTLALYLSDSPIDAENITGVYITINEIQYHLNDQWMTC